MAIESNEVFDFGPERMYNPSLLAETVIWPLVDTLWRGNWREESQDGYAFQFPKQGSYKGRTLEVQLEADCDDYQAVDDLPEKIVRSATLYIEEASTDVNRKIILEAARVAAQESSEYFDDDDDEDEPCAWPEGGDDDLVVMKGALYSFDTEGDWFVELYRAVQGPEQRLNVPLCEAEKDASLEGRLRLFDIENIEAGCYILNSPRAVMKAIEKIKGRPILIQ